jgi:methyl coenzyme M reductase subunit D
MTETKPVTNVRVELGFTKNLGNFENLRVSIGVEDYVRDGETVDDATERVYGFIENKIVEKVNEIQKEIKGNG